MRKFILRKIQNNVILQNLWQKMYVRYIIKIPLIIFLLWALLKALYVAFGGFYFILITS